MIKQIPKEKHTPDVTSAFWDDFFATRRRIMQAYKEFLKLRERKPRTKAQQLAYDRVLNDLERLQKDMIELRQAMSCHDCGNLISLNKGYKGFFNLECEAYPTSKNPQNRIHKRDIGLCAYAIRPKEEKT